MAPVATHLADPEKLLSTGGAAGVALSGAGATRVVGVGLAAVAGLPVADSTAAGTGEGVAVPIGKAADAQPAARPAQRNSETMRRPITDLPPASARLSLR
jgi:hypothetical protein